MARPLPFVALAVLLVGCTSAVADPPPVTMATTTTVVVPVPSSDASARDFLVDGEEWIVATGAPVVIGEVVARDVIIRSEEPVPPVGGTDFVTEAFGVRVERAIPYAEAATVDGSRELLLDLYTPEGDGRADRPGFVAIHGGGFFGGSRLGVPPTALCETLAARGHVCVSIDYRLIRDDPPVGEGPVLARTIAAAVEDAASAVAWMRGRSDELGVDPDRISIGGSSAGAITALLTAFTVEGIGIHRVVDLWGAMYGEVEAVSPDGPPVLIVHGALDRTVAFPLAVDLMDKLSREGVPFEAYPFASEGHGVPLDAEVGGILLLDRIAAFVGS